MRRILVACLAVSALPLCAGYFRARGNAYTPPAAAVTAAFTATKIQGTTCVAPCGVHLDATASTATGVDRPWSELTYRWDLGAPDMGTWDYGSQPVERRLRNEPRGPITGGVYDRPGTYTITLHVSNAAGDEDVETHTVTVADPVATITEANTYCFRQDTSGDFHGCPLDTNDDGTCDGASSGNCRTDPSFSDSINDPIASNGCNADASPMKACYFRRGDTFTGDATVVLWNGGSTPGVVGAFGSGARPKVTDADPITISPGWTVASLDLTVSTSTDDVLKVGTSNSNATAYDVKSTGSLAGCFSTATGGGTMSDLVGLFGIDCAYGTPGTNGSAVFLRSERTLIMGSRIDLNSESEFAIRTIHAYKSAFQYNDLLDPGETGIGGYGDRNPIQIRAWGNCCSSGHGCTQPGPAAEPTQYVVISDNKLVYAGNGTANMTIRIAQDNLAGSTGCDVDNEGDPQDVLDVLVERNFAAFNSTTSTTTLASGFVSGQGGRITVRDNVIDAQGLTATAASMRLATHVDNYSKCSACSDDEFVVQGNTLYYAADLNLPLDLCTAATGVDHVCEGNLIERPLDRSVAGSDVTSGAGTWASTTGNLYAATDPLAAVPGAKGTTSIASFGLTAAAHAAKDTVATPNVDWPRDAIDLRPSGAHDAGALEYAGVAGSDVPSPSLTGLNLEKLGAETNKYGWILFANVMHTAKRQEVGPSPFTDITLHGIWDARDASTYATQSGYAIVTDANGYPTETFPYDPPGAVTNVVARAEVLYSNPYAPHGTYVLTFTGTGTPNVRVSGDATTQTCTSSPCNVVVHPTGSSAGVTVDIIQGNVTAMSLLVPAEQQLGIWYRPTIDQLRGVDAIRSMNATWVNHYTCTNVVAATDASCVHTWAGRQPSAAFQSGRKGLAWEHFFALANEIGADAWVTVPHAAEDAYWTGLSNLAESTLNAGNRFIVEYSNEAAWGGFDQQAYLLATANARSYTGTNAEKQQKAYVANLAAGVVLAEAAWDASHVYTVLGSQYASTTVTNNELTYWDSATACAGSPCNPGGADLDAVAVAPYLGNLTWDTYSACSGGGCPSAATLIAQALPDMQTEMAGYLPAQASIITAAGLEIVAYEGGTLIAPGPGDPSNSTLRGIVDDAVFLDPGAYDLITAYHDGWNSSSGKLFMHFGWVHPETTTGQIMIPNATDAPRTPMWRALQQRIRAMRN